MSSSSDKPTKLATPTPIPLPRIPRIKREGNATSSASGVSGVSGKGSVSSASGKGRGSSASGKGSASSSSGHLGISSPVIKKSNKLPKIPKKKKLTTIEEYVFYHPLIKDEIDFANHISAIAKESAISLLTTDEAKSIVDSFKHTTDIEQDTKKYNEMLLDEFDMDEIIQTCPSQDAPEEINVIRRIPVRKFIKGRDESYDVLLSMLDNLIAFRCGSDIYRSNLQITVTNYSNGVKISYINNDLEFSIKIKNMDGYPECSSTGATVASSIKLKLIIDVIYNGATLFHVSFFGDRSNPGITPAYVRMSSLHFTTEKDYTFTKNKEYVFINLRNIINIYQFADGDITKFISLILNLISNVFKISDIPMEYQTSTMSQDLKKFVEGLCMNVINSPELKDTRIKTIRARERERKKKERERETERGSMVMDGGGRNRKIKSSKPIKKPIKKSDKPVKKSDKPIKKSDKPVKKSDKPVKKSDKPVKKPVKKSDKPVKKSVKKTTKKARDGV